MIYIRNIYDANHKLLINSSLKQYLTTINEGITEQI
jgi:hypothetical protein